MSNLEMWSAVVGFLMPVLVAFVMRTSWSQPVRALVGFILCGIAATITVIVVGDMGTRLWVGSALTVLTVALVTYEKWWKPIGAISTLESMTNK